MSDPTPVRAGEDAGREDRELLASLERELGVHGVGPVFRKALAIAKEASKAGEYSGFSGAGVQTVIGSRKDIDLVQRWCNEASTIPYLKDRIASAEARASAAEAEVARLKGELEEARDGWERWKGLHAGANTIIRQLEKERDAALAANACWGATRISLTNDFDRLLREAREDQLQSYRKAEAAEAEASALRERVARLDEANRQIAELLKPHGERPCDCIRCDCGNPGDTAYTAAWDRQNDLYNAARAALTEGAPTDV